jgi:transposase
MTGMLLGQSSPRGLDPWGERMLAPDEVAAMVQLHKFGWGTKRIAGELGCSRNTVKRYLAAGGWAAIRPPQRKRRLDGFEEWLAQRFRQHRGNCDVVRQDLLREHGVRVSLRTVERAVAPLRQALQAEARACVRFETPPGQQLQIDFGGTTVSIGGEPVRVHLFVATLGYSRRPFVRAFRHERQTAWFDGLESAFRHFDGVPREVVFDNARALDDYHDAATREVRFNERLHAFARYWRFHPHACAPYRARTKGKDERGVGYVKRNAIAGHDFISWAALEGHLDWWMREIADQRVHGTTGEVPLARFQREEAGALDRLTLT